MFKASHVHYEMAERVQAVNCGGIGAIHDLVQRLGLVEDIDRNLHLLKVHLPYHESDHVLNIAYNIVVGRVRLEDIEQRRQDETFLNGLDAQRIPARRRREISPGGSWDTIPGCGTFLRPWNGCSGWSWWNSRGPSQFSEKATTDVVCLSLAKNG